MALKYYGRIEKILEIAMGVIYLPCEIYHREFDAKLLLAVQLFKKYKHQSIIGYDKYFGTILKRGVKGVLLDKSCSSIMWEGRIKHSLMKGGKALVNDEEGFIHINEKHASTWVSRVDQKAALSIDKYICWGSIDYSFFSSRVPNLREKLVVNGNCRSDLVSRMGKAFYKDKIGAIESIYGQYYLCSDNFSVERRRKGYKHPAYNISDEENIKVQKQYEMTTNQNRSRREVYSNILEEAICNHPDINFIIRPHPVSDPRWWSERFWKYHNVHIINILNLEPWLLSSRGLISMGCTSALQAQIAGVDSFNIANIDENIEYNFKFPEALLGIKIKNGKELSKAVELKKKSQKNLSFMSQPNREILKNIWKYSENDTVSKEYAKEMHEIMPHSQDSLFNSTANDIIRIRPALEKSFAIDPDKWIRPSFFDIKKKHDRWCKLLNCKDSKISKLCDGLYCISKK